MIKIELTKGFDEKLHISRAWDGSGNLIIDQNSDVRPELVIENGMITDILLNGLNIDIPEFEPFPAVEGVVSLQGN